MNMAVERVAILSPGDMGHAVGKALRQGGLGGYYLPEWSKRSDARFG